MVFGIFSNWRKRPCPRQQQPCRPRQQQLEYVALKVWPGPEQARDHTSTSPFQREHIQKGNTALWLWRFFSQVPLSLLFSKFSPSKAITLLNDVLFDTRRAWQMLTWFLS